MVFLGDLSRHLALPRKSMELKKCLALAGSGQVSGVFGCACANRSGGLNIVAVSQRVPLFHILKKGEKAKWDRADSRGTETGESQWMKVTQSFGQGNPFNAQVFNGICLVYCHPLPGSCRAGPRNKMAARALLWPTQGQFTTPVAYSRAPVPVALRCHRTLQRHIWACSWICSGQLGGHAVVPFQLLLWGEPE